MKPVEKSQPKSFTFSCLLLKMKEERTHFVDSKGSDKQKWYQLLLQTVQKSQQNFVVDKYYKKWLEGYKKKSLSDLLTY